MKVLRVVRPRELRRASGPMGTKPITTTKVR